MWLFSKLPVPILAAAVLTIISPHLYAQDYAFANWAAWFNNAKFSEKWGLVNDIQFRAGKDWSNNSLLLIRPGINYYIDSKQTVAAGYATTLVTGQLAAGGRRLTEHRIWQQYILTGRLGSAAIQHRFRLEQRFLRRPDETIFAQRFRYFVRGVIPFTRASEDAFTRGPYGALQNELFFNIQHNHRLNGHIFDQNRAYVAAGFRFSRRYDLEVGYMNQFLVRKDPAPNLMSHIVQLALYTRL